MCYLTMYCCTNSQFGSFVFSRARVAGFVSQAACNLAPLFWLLALLSILSLDEDQMQNKHIQISSEAYKALLT